MKLSKEEIKEILSKKNEGIIKERRRVYQESLGVTSIIYKSLPQKVRKEDLCAEIYEPERQHNLIVITDAGAIGCKDLAEVAEFLSIDLDEKTILELIEQNLLQVSTNYSSVLEEYLQKFR